MTSSEEYRGFTITPAGIKGDPVNHYVVRASWDPRVWWPASSITEARKLIYDWWADASLQPGESRRDH